MLYINIFIYKYELLGLVFTSTSFTAFFFPPFTIFGGLFLNKVVQRGVTLLCGEVNECAVWRTDLQK